MQLDFRKHKKSRRFPFTIIGVLLAVILIALFVYLTKENASLKNLFDLNKEKNILDLFYFSFIIIHFLFLIFSFAIIKQLRSSIKTVTILILTGYCVFGALTGYYYDSVNFMNLLSIYFLFAISYYVFYLITFIFQNNSLTVYKSFLVAVISAFPMVPLAVINYSMFNQIAFSNTITNISNYVYLFSILLYIITNSIYLCTINRKV